MVARAYRTGDAGREERCLYLGRLDTLELPLIEQRRGQVRALGDTALSLAFDALLVKLGHPAPLPSLRDVDLATVRTYGPELTLYRLGDELRAVELIEAHSPKGGGPPLGKMAIALAIYANLRPGSYARFPEWYRRSALPLFLRLPPEQVTYEATLNTLSYLQPERTRPWEAELYRRVLKTFHYRCERVDIDSTVKELDGRLCRVLAKFGRSKTGTTSKRRQIMITFLVDQKGSLLGHEVFPGNKNDMKTLAPIDRRLRQDYGEEVAKAPRVVDRGYSSLENVRKLQRRKEPFLVALKAHAKGLKLLEELGPQKDWREIRPGVRAASVERGPVKYVVTWNDEVAGRNGDGRRAKRKQAQEALTKLAKAVAEGRVKSRSEREKRVGAILTKYGMKKILRVQGAREGFGFTVEETEVLGAREEEDGYQVYATTERWLTEGDVVDFYRKRDRIEKAIRTMSACLGLAPVRVATPEHVRGHFFVHALGYQLRNAGQLRLEEKGETMSIDEALWELEQLQVAELTVKGSEVGIHRKLTRMDGTVARLVQVFSLEEKGQLPGLEGGI
ncbi:transposase, IS4 family protein [mine drainage metagenome]|uniref:Transposase, IS4 family protein n=1 Tax=mine drainage metagenome TaxID=410659 RepID=T1AI16_9ZZZZ